MLQALHRARARVGDAAIQCDTYTVPGSAARGAAPRHAELAGTGDTPTWARGSTKRAASLPPSRLTALQSQLSQNAQMGPTFPSASGAICGINGAPAEGNSQPNLAIDRSTTVSNKARTALPTK